MLVSQIGYIGCIITPRPEQITEMQEIINRYVTKGIVIAEDRLYLKPKHGGLGLINLRSYITALQCSWVKRCKIRINDPWRWNLAAACDFELDGLKPDRIDRNLNPVEYNIACSFEEFRKRFFTVNENYLCARMVDNDMFLRAAPGRRQQERGCIDRNLLGPEFYDGNKEMLQRINMNVLIQNGVVVSYQNLRASSGLNFSQAAYFRLVTAGNFAIKKYSKAENNNGTSESIVSFLNGIKKGSKRFRKILEKRSGGKKMEDMRVVLTFFGLIECVVPDPHELRKLCGLWNWNFLSNRIRTFSFQFFNNSLGIRSRIAARYRNTGVEIDQRCTFCQKSRSGVAMREDFAHVFYDCPFIRPVCENIFTTYYNVRVNDLDRKKIFFTGMVDTLHNGDQTLYLLTATLINYTIWQWRLKKLIPSIASVKNDVDFLFECIADASKTIENLAINSGIPICRRWRAGRYGRG
jgi:hypothetical protein